MLDTTVRVFFAFIVALSLALTIGWLCHIYESPEAEPGIIVCRFFGLFLAFHGIYNAALVVLFGVEAAE